VLLGWSAASHQAINPLAGVSAAADSTEPPGHRSGVGSAIPEESRRQRPQLQFDAPANSREGKNPDSLALFLL
jgi:hypothetical protein